MELRPLFGFLFLLLVTLVSTQYYPPPQDDFIEPRSVLSIANRRKVLENASGLTAARAAGRTVTPNISKMVRDAKTRVEEMEAALLRRRRPFADRTRFPFGPQLKVSERARAIGRTGRVFLETFRVMANGSSSRPSNTPVRFPALPPSIRNELGCPFQAPTDCNFRSVFRTITGVCNNVQNPLFGSTNTPFERSAPSAYEDGISKPRSSSVLGGPLPLPRKISFTVHQASGVRTLDNRFTQITMEFGQFVSHDIERFAVTTDANGSELQCCPLPTEQELEFGCFPIDIPANDPFFSRFGTRCMEMVRAASTPPLNCQLGAREQLNQETAYLDGSAVYGSTEELARELRVGREGLLKNATGPDGELLPQDTTLNFPKCRSQNGNLCFKAGDERVNQQPALMSMHTLWMREHNRVARRLSRINPGWDDERLYQEARKVVGAEFQHVVYDEFLPVIVGKEVAEEFDFPARRFGYNSDYISTINPQIRSAFSAAGYRFGHSLVQLLFAREKPFSENFLRPDIMYEKNRGTSFVVQNLFQLQQQKCDRLISPQLTTTLFETAPGNGIDLAATNIQRARDFGVPSYNVFRVLCGLPRVTNFGTGPGGLVDHNLIAAGLLEKTYRHVDDIDLWTGAVSEKVLRGAVVGPTIACVIGRQFFLLKKGDRFFYENDDPSAKFTPPQLDEIRKTSLARVICDNTNTNTVQREAFRIAGNENSDVNCGQIPSVDLTKWRTNTCIDGGWSDWTYSQCIYFQSSRSRSCNNPPPNHCGRSCQGASYEVVGC